MLICLFYKSLAFVFLLPLYQLIYFIFYTWRPWRANIPTNEQTCFLMGLLGLGQTVQPHGRWQKSVLKRIKQVGVKGVICVEEARGGYLKVKQTQSPVETVDTLKTASWWEQISKTYTDVPSDIKLLIWCWSHRVSQNWDI